MFYGSCRTLQRNETVGYVLGFTDAHSQGQTMDELNKNLQEVIAVLLEDGKTIRSS